MAQTLKVLIDGQFLTTSPAAYYTAPANKQTVIRRLVITNVSGADATVTLYLVSGLGSPSNSNMVIKARTLIAGESYVSPECSSQILGNAGKIVATASLDNSLNVYASGVETT